MVYILVILLLRLVNLNMDESLYHLHYELEDQHWWFQGRAAIALHLIKHFCVIDKQEHFLDVGCGTGMMLQKLSDLRTSVGIDSSSLAIEYAKTRGLKHIFCGDLSHLDTTQWSFRVALLLDVIEHVEDDIGLLRQVHQCLLPQGQVVITVPAYPWLWSQHDVINHHYRRYTASSLKKSLQCSGFHIQKISFFNTFLFLPAMLKKFMDRNSKIVDATTTIPKVSDRLNIILQFIFASERHLLPYINFPFGISLIAIATKT